MPIKKLVNIFPRTATVKAPLYIIINNIHHKGLFSRHHWTIAKEGEFAVSRSSVYCVRGVISTYGHHYKIMIMLAVLGLPMTMLSSIPVRNTSNTSSLSIMRLCVMEIETTRDATPAVNLTITGTKLMQAYHQEE